MKKKGFTLIELLVVVAIIGLLAAMAVIALNNARWKARDSRRLADIKQIRTALEMFYSDSSTGYPSASSINLGGLCLSSTNGWNAACAGTTYLASSPTNPSPRTDGGCPNQDYIYNSASGTTYTVSYCLGANTGGVPSGNSTSTPSSLY